MTNYVDNMFNILHQQKQNVSESNTIKDAVWRSMYFSSKKAGECELSGKSYNSYELYLAILDGAQNINPHHCSGNIIYHEDNKSLLNDANCWFECQETIIQNHSWANKNVTIQRSNGDKINVAICKNSCIRIQFDKILFYVEFIENDEVFNKWVPLVKYFSNSKQKEILGILDLNPELINEELILTIKNHPEWMNDERQKWKKQFEDKLNESGVKYTFVSK